MSNIGGGGTIKKITVMSNTGREKETRDEVGKG